jgi:TPR repeat protein
MAMAVRSVFLLVIMGFLSVLGCRSTPKVITPVETTVQVYEGKTLEDILPLALEGDIPAMMTLAYRYEQGIGTPQDFNKAAEWYLHAAQCRDVEATYRLALIYANPDSPLYNFKSGKAWLRRAKRMGHAQAGVKLYAYPTQPLTK